MSNIRAKRCSLRVNIIDRILNSKINEISIYAQMIARCFTRLIDILFNAKFLFFSIVTIGIGTIGVWVPVAFQIDLSSTHKLCAEFSSLLPNGSEVLGTPEACRQPRRIGFENFALFMYIAGVLGMLAAEFFIKNEKPEGPVGEAILSFAMCVWFISLILSFWGLKEPTESSWQLWVSVWLAISLWLSSTYVNGDFNLDLVKKKLSGEATGGTKGSSGQFAGDGLDE